MIMAAMGSNFAGADGHTTEQLTAYYEARARGGVGLIVLETSAITWPSGASMPFMIGFSKDEFIDDLKSFTDRMHQHGAKVAAQLNHSGKIAQEDTVAAGPHFVPYTPQPVPRHISGLHPKYAIIPILNATSRDGKPHRYT